jgi:hypothetical protein
MNLTKSAVIKRLTLICFLLLTLLLIILALVHKPNRYGDGWEYYGMTISFANHFTPNLTAEDIIERKEASIKYNIEPSTIDQITYSGYFKDSNGSYYSYHFWFYSLLCTPGYIFLKLLNMNTFKTFQLTNIIMFIVMLGWILYRSSFSNKKKLWLIVVSILNPICLYLAWSHSEVFSYIFLFIGLIELYERRKIPSIILISIASLQNPAIAIIPMGIIVYHLFKERKLDRQLFYLCVSSSITVIPYLFYYIHYKKFSLITSVGAASLHDISINKVSSLFFDLNFGMIVFIPLLVGVMIWNILKRDKATLLWGLCLLLMAAICSTQNNWNPGMMYINRYTVWMIPIVVMTTLHFFSDKKWTEFIVYLSLFVLTTGSVLIYCLLKYDESQYLRFSPLAKYVISVAPALYNPPSEVFVERALGAEVNLKAKQVPLVIVANESGIRKAYDNKGSDLEGYLNGKVNLTLSNNIFVLKDLNQNQDIFTEKQFGGFLSGWYGLEQSQDAKARWRWTNNVAELVFNSNENKSKNIEMNIEAFLKVRDCVVFINGNQVYAGDIGTHPQKINFMASLNEGMNKLRIVSAATSTVPKDIKELNSGDSRPLSFMISSLSMK